MNVTDLVVLGSIILLVFTGTARGFLRSLVGPLSFVISAILAYSLYQINRDFTLSLFIAFLGPIILSWILGGLLHIWQMKEGWTPNPLSQLLGAIVSLVWGMIFVIVMLIIGSLLPPINTWFKVIREDVQKSFFYAQIRPTIHRFAPPTPSTPPANNDVNAKVSVSNINTNSNDFQALANDPRFKAVAQDPKIQAYINDGNYAALLANPKVMDLTEEMMKDPELMKRLLRLSQSQSQPAPQAK